MRYVRKRDGKLAEFDNSRIENAIGKAARAVGEGNEEMAAGVTHLVMGKLLDRFGDDGCPTVEEIQDIVEETIIMAGFARTAKAYILYRQKQIELRELAAGLSSDDMIERYLMLDDWKIKENSNMSYSLQGLNNYISSNVISRYWTNRIYPQNIREAHTSGAMHIHDLAVLGPYCVGWDLPDLLLSGFKGVEGKISSKPAKHFRTALGQIVNFFYTLQGEAAGAQAFSNFDTYLAPFIKYDNLSQDDVNQAFQEFLFNINVPTRVGFQTPFTNVTMDMNVPKFLRNEPVVLGGKFHNDDYGDFQDELDMFNIGFANAMNEGDANGRVFTFPIATYSITDDFDWDSPVSQKIFEMTAKYGTPYFSNFLNSDMSPEDVRSMCCRLRIDNRELRKRGGGLFGANPLTGSIGVVTLNLPRIGYTVKSEDAFMERVYELMDLSKDSLEIKRKTVEKLSENGLYPYSAFYLRNVKEAFGSYWKNHFSTVGLLGMNEAIVNLMGSNINTPEGLAFAERVLKGMRDRLSDYQEETGNIYNLEATPAEGTSYRLARMDKQRYGSIKVANEDKLRPGVEPFYTNSSHMSVDESSDLFDVLEHQNNLQPLYTGGTVFHTFLGERLHSWKAAANLIKKMAENTNMPYFTLTPTFSVCPTHGYITGEAFTCPTCASECEVYSRVVGYMRPVKQWNDGKQAEFSIRSTFDAAAPVIEGYDD
ncbi:ribonucleoside triphosphate reductase [Candidatus Bathyarchaeota archaeon]|nr:ribonucleoside triphosphate reductase [Candidatus Bathyarchaeota archaeon]MBT4319293.1 ribonucleoside triphosphate reductase [Candidatus Bathyarchaeota archaeon]MBT4422905.1 ribonucleoside triphosphate reductase [Candidatus Bathyarchaeota archaeon]MBT5642209.1 ribonucleoside triphosphate reductase [Candidatus Bathyarchaeota archaeon]MBT6603857.1 ribonucleoside triphosphate reductase [Candidatus Bathyarchaeota archaeon]